MFSGTDRGGEPAPSVTLGEMSDPAAKVLETQRLVLRRFSLDDAAFVFEIVNDPAWLQNIGDRHVKTLDDARPFLEVSAQREGLDDVDIGFAFLPQFRGRGFALEAAAVLEHGKRDLGLKRIVAIVSSANHRSIRIVEKIGLEFERLVKLPGDHEEIPLYAYPSDDSSVWA
jgi:RimJ/RimL family protein N-acetyltransferase